ncbi:MAG: glycosyl transferase family 3 [Shimia sp.]
MSLSTYVAILGRGQGRARSLTQAEMTLMLDPATPAEAVGAILMLLRMKGEAAEEIAGFAAAAQAACPPVPGVTLDWPTYAAGRTRGAPLFLEVAQMVAETGVRVLIHGWNGTDPKVRAGIAAAGIPIATSAVDAGQHLAKKSIAFLPLDHLHAPLLRLLRLREVLGPRSCVNTVCRMLNPGRAEASVQGVFHPSYRALQADAAQRLGWRALSVIKGGGGEFERNPLKPTTPFGLRNGVWWLGAEPARTPADPMRETVIQTATLALDTLGHAQPHDLAQTLWAARHPLQATG